MTSRALPPRGIGAPPRGRPAPAQAWWPWVRKALWLAFFALVAVLLARQARTIAWHEVLQTLQALPAPVLWWAGALALASHALYATFDLLGRRATGHRLRTPTVMLVTFISYAFNLNLGSLLGGVASRYRLYGRLGLAPRTITGVTAFSMLTNWLGYTLLLGLALVLWPLPVPEDWQLDAPLLQAIGCAMVLTVLAYALLCAFSSHRHLHWRGHTVALASGRMALLQLAVSCLNWSLMAGAIYLLLQRQVDYGTTLTVLLMAAIAGVITHVPAGLGVLEAVFIALLGQQIAPAVLVGTLLAYRALYYLVPLALAVPAFLLLELRLRRHPHAPP